MKDCRTSIMGIALLSCIVSVPARAQTGGGAVAVPTPATAQAMEMKITRNGSKASAKGLAQNFTGSVRVDPLFSANKPSRVGAAYVSFEPGARSAWHSHPLGQTLVVTAGVGRVQQWGGKVEEIRPGDVIWTPPGVKHWHGASPTNAMTHLAISEQHEREAVTWMEKVSDAQYNALWPVALIH